MYSRIPTDYNLTGKQIDETEVNRINDRLMLLRSKMQDLSVFGSKNILGPSGIHIEIINGSIDRMITGIVDKNIDPSFSECISTLNKIEEYFTLISKP